MAKVYVVNKGPHNYDDAQGFGELIYCTDGSMDKFDLSQMYRELDESMFDSEPEDYILLTSLTALCCVACSIFAAKHRRVNLLLFRGNGYLSRSIHLNKE